MCSQGYMSSCYTTQPNQKVYKHLLHSGNMVRKINALVHANFDIAKPYADFMGLEHKSLDKFDHMSGDAMDCLTKLIENAGYRNPSLMLDINEEPEEYLDSETASKVRV